MLFTTDELSDLLLIGACIFLALSGLALLFGGDPK